MRHFILATSTMLFTLACGSNQPAESPSAEVGDVPADDATSDAPAESAGATDSPAAEDDAPGTEGENAFVLGKSDTAKDAHGTAESKIKPTKTEAALKFFVVDKDKGPIEGVVISLTAPDGTKYYTKETDSAGYAEVLVPVGKKYSLVYLSLGRKDIAASVPVTDEPNQNVKLTLRYKRHDRKQEQEVFVLEGVLFDTGKATLRPESFPRLDRVVEYMTHKKRARIQISGHTDNVGDANANKVLSENRAKACREYLVSKGIDGARVTAVGYGSEQPIATNDTPEGRQLNRRIEATEL